MRLLAPLGTFAAASVVVLAVVASSEHADPDLWGRLSVAAVLFEAGHLPRLDDFSYTARGAPWIDHEWLAGVVFYGTLEAFGEPGLVLLKWGLLLLALAGSFALARLHGGTPRLWWAATLVALPVFLLGYLTTVRAQVLSFAAFVWTLWWLEAVRTGRVRPPWLLALLPLAVAWGNAHGGFVMGTLAIGLYGVAALVEGRRRAAAAWLGLALGTVAVVAVINPYGLDYLGFLLHSWTFDRRFVTEWQPLLSWPLRPLELVALVLALAAGALAVRGAWQAWQTRGEPAGGLRQSALAPSLVLLLLVAMSLRAMRIQTFLAFALVGLLPLLVGAVRRGATPARPRAAVAATAVQVLLALLAAGWLATLAAQRPLLSAVVLQQPPPDARGATAYPVGLVHWLRQSPYRGRLLNPFTQGEFLYWTLYPRFRVAIDGRYEEVYTQEQFLDAYRFFVEAPLVWHRQLAFANASDADFALFASSWPNLDRLASSPGWRKVYDDGGFALVARESSLARFPPYAGPRGRPAARLGIASYFTARDRERFRDYPSSIP